MDEPTREAFRSFGVCLGVVVTFCDAISRPAWFPGLEPPILVVPGSFTPAQQGALGAELAIHMLTGRPVAFEEVA